MKLDVKLQWIMTWFVKFLEIIIIFILFVYLFEAVVHYIAENLRHKETKPGDQQDASDDPHRGDGAGSSRHVCRC